MLVIWLWQCLLLSNYASMEWFITFMIGHTSMLIIVLVYRLSLKIKIAEISKIQRADLGVFISVYFIYGIISTIATAMAFDCGI